MEIVLSRTEKVLRRKVYSDNLYIINKLKYSTNFDDFTYNKESCPICLIECNKEYFIFNCKHFMHAECEIKYNKSVCPICNTCISGIYKSNKNGILTIRNYVYE